MEDTEPPQDVTGDTSTPHVIPSDFSDANFARRLREVREQARMTQQTLADLMAGTGNKFHRSTIAKIENGDRPVTIGEAVQLAGILGVNVLDLIRDRLPESPQARQMWEALIAAEVACRSAEFRLEASKHAFSRASDELKRATAERDALFDHRNMIIKEMKDRGTH